MTELNQAVDVKDIPEVSEEQKTYIPPMGNSEFAINCVGAAWNVVTTGILNLMKADIPQEQKEKDVLALMQKLRESHILTVQHTSEFIDNYEYHLIQERNFDPVVEYLLQDLIIGIKNNYTAIPREKLAERNPETDKDPNWKYGAMPLARIFAGERIPVKIQTNKQTAYGYYECLNRQIPNPSDPTKVINIQTTVPCIRIKQGQIAPNAVWRWQEITEERLKTHWLKGEVFFDSVPKAKPQPQTEANPIEKAPETEGNDNGDTGQESSDTIANQ